MTYTQAQVIQIITDEANALGVPVNLALAIAKQESGLNANAVGDGGHSIGLFQLNDQGEGHGMSVAQREDPATNARIALTQVANVLKANPGMSPGQIAAAAQRPADRAGYAKAIDTALGQQLSPEQYADMSPEGIIYRQNAQAGGTGSGMSLNDFMRIYAPELATAMNDPEIKNLLTQYDNGSLSQQQFEAQLEQTDWWKSTPASERNILADRATDPATAAQNLSNEVANINTLAARLGIGITPAQATSLATQYMANNWGADQLQQALSQYARYSGDGVYKGEAGTDVQQIKNLYAQYALPVSDATLNAQLQQVLSGKVSVQDFTQGVAQQAATLYSSNPQLAQFLKSGQGTTQQWADPYVQKAAQLLGTNPNSIDLTAPMWAKILNPGTDPTTGKPTGQAMSLDQWDQMLRNDPQYGFDTSINGRQQGAQLGLALGRITGTGGM